MNNPLWYTLHTLVDLLRRKKYMICTDMPDTYCIFNKIYNTVILIYNASNSGPYKLHVTEKKEYLFLVSSAFYHGKSIPTSDSS